MFFRRAFFYDIYCDIPLTRKAPLYIYMKVFLLNVKSFYILIAFYDLFITFVFLNPYLMIIWKVMSAGW